MTQKAFLAVLNGECKYDSTRGRLSAFFVGVARNQTTIPADYAVTEGGRILRRIKILGLSKPK